MRLVVGLAVLGACHARVDSNAAIDARTDAPIGINPDAPPDAAIDARPCTGGDGAASDGTSCFVYFLGPKTWVEAKAVCDALPGGHMAIVISTAQNTLIASLVQGHDSFLGMTDAVTEGTWLWVDGTAPTFTNWRLGEPSNGQGMYEEDCLVIEGSKTPDDTWDDRPCDASQVATSGSFAYVCEY